MDLLWKQDARRESIPGGMTRLSICEHIFTGLYNDAPGVI